MLEFHGFTSQYTLKSFPNEKDLFIQIADMFLIKKNETEAHLLIFPETEVFDSVLEEHVDGFVKAYKNKEGKISFYTQEMHKKAYFLIHKKEFLSHFNVKNGILLFHVNYVDVSDDDLHEESIYVEIESTVNRIEEVLPLSSYSVEELNDAMDIAHTTQNWERAAKIRDEQAKR